MAPVPWPEDERAGVGLCADCHHARRVESLRGSTFCLCGLSAVDSTFPKYPRLPVLQCSGHAPRHRIVSLLASGTEIVCALGGGDELVGRSQECDNPDWVRNLPCCTGPTFDITASSGEIDREVRRRLKASEPLYDVDVALVNELHPTLLLTQTQCAVCAVTPDDVKRTAGDLVAEQVVALSAGCLTGIYDGIRSVAHALGRDEAGDRLTGDLQRQIDRTTNQVRDRYQPTVVLLEWTDPLFATGNWGPELVVAAGGRPLLGETGRFSASVSWDQVVEADPDYLVVAPCGFSLERALQEIPTLEALRGWSEMRAVMHGRVALADGNKYFNRSGTTVADTVRVLGEILHADCFEPSWQGRAWRAYRPPTA